VLLFNFYGNNADRKQQNCNVSHFLGKSLVNTSAEDHNYGASVGGPSTTRKTTFLDNWLRGTSDRGPPRTRKTTFMDKWLKGWFFYNLKKT